MATTLELYTAIKLLENALELVYNEEMVDRQGFERQDGGLFPMTVHHRCMPAPLRERLRKLK